MSKEWNEQKKKRREKDEVLIDNIWGTLFWIMIAACLIAIDLAQHGYRFGF